MGSAERVFYICKWVVVAAILRAGILFV